MFYEYLHNILLQAGDTLKAASATYTALLRNPDDDMMMKNLEFYVNKLEPNNEQDLIKDYDEPVISQNYIITIIFNVANFHNTLEICKILFKRLAII